MIKTKSYCLFFVFLFFFILSCNNKKQVKVITLDSLFETKAKSDSIQPVIKKEIDSLITVVADIPPEKDSINRVAQKVLTALKEKNYRLFADYFHPIETVLFAPYGFIKKNISKRLLAKDFLETIDKNWTLTWGVYKNSDEKIQLKVIPYIEKFIYDADFLNAEKTAFDQVVEKDSPVNNILEIFPNLHYFDYYFYGSDSEDKDKAGKSLRLVFKKYNGQYYIVGIIHE